RRRGPWRDRWLRSAREWRSSRSSSASLRNRSRRTPGRRKGAEKPCSSSLQDSPFLARIEQRDADTDENAARGGGDPEGGDRQPVQPFPRPRLRVRMDARLFLRDESLVLLDVARVELGGRGVI